MPLLILLLVPLILFIGPALLVAGINLMGLAVVPLTLKSWFGAFLIIITLGGASKSSK